MDLITSLRHCREDKKAEGCFLMKFLFSKISYEDDIFTHDLGIPKETKEVFFLSHLIPPQLRHFAANKYFSP